MKFLHALMLSFSLMIFGLSTANAAVAVGVTTALTDSATDVGTVGALVLATLVVVATFRYIKRAL